MDGEFPFTRLIRVIVKIFKGEEKGDYLYVKSNKVEVHIVLEKWKDRRGSVLKWTEVVVVRVLSTISLRRRSDRTGPVRFVPNGPRWGPPFSFY